MLNRFLTNIRFNDFNIEFNSDVKDKSLNELKKKLNYLAQKFEEINREKEENYFYIQNVIEHIDIGILAFDTEGEIKLVNKSLLHIFNIKYIDNIAGFKIINPEFYNEILKIEPHENKISSIKSADGDFQFSIYASRFSSNEEIIKLISIKNITKELNNQEILSWQKLIRVLTHEIMNSIAPISSLSSTLKIILDNAEIAKENVTFDAESYEDVKEAVATIHNRSEGLIHFVETFRSITKIPEPKRKIHKLSKIIHNAVNLFAAQLEEKGIEYQEEISPPDIEAFVDKSLIEQVLINLLKNAVEALAKTPNPQITVKCKTNRLGQPEIQIQDNGQGMLPEIQEKIFIPFFTTKQTGSGIGLSLSRQIISMHKVSIQVKSQKGKTIFTITL